MRGLAYRSRKTNLPHRYGRQGLSLNLMANTNLSGTVSSTVNTVPPGCSWMERPSPIDHIANIHRPFGFGLVLLRLALCPRNRVAGPDGVRAG